MGEKAEMVFIKILERLDRFGIKLDKIIEEGEEKIMEEKIEMIFTTILERLNIRLDEIIEKNGYQEMADGCDQAIKVVNKYMGELEREET